MHLRKMQIIGVGWFLSFAFLRSPQISNRPNDPYYGSPRHNTIFGTFRKDLNKDIIARLKPDENQLSWFARKKNTN